MKLKLLASIAMVCASTQLTGCATMSTTEAGSQWVLKRINQQPIPVDYAPTLDFSADGKITGHAGCNQFSGEYQRDGGSISIGSLSTTRKMCVPIQMQVEKQYLRLLASASGFEVLCGNLTLGSGEETLVFDPKRGL